MDSCEKSLQAISWKTISWYQYKHNHSWQTTSFSSHQRWEVLGKILHREGKKIDKELEILAKIM